MTTLQYRSWQKICHFVYYFNGVQSIPRKKRGKVKFEIEVCRGWICWKTCLQFSCYLKEIGSECKERNSMQCIRIFKSTTWQRPRKYHWANDNVSWCTRYKTDDWLITTLGNWTFWETIPHANLWCCNRAVCLWKFTYTLWNYRWNGKPFVPGTVFSKLVQTFITLTPHSIAPEHAVSCHTILKGPKQSCYSREAINSRMYIDSIGTAHFGPIPAVAKFLQKRERRYSQPDKNVYKNRDFARKFFAKG